MGKEKQKRPVSTEGLLSPAMAALRLGLSRSRVYGMAAAGEIPSIKFGRAVRFDPKDVERFIREHRRGKAKAA